ncbi:hypothetical protein ACLOJK_003446, partial [Asimina triloba]
SDDNLVLLRLRRPPIPVVGAREPKPVEDKGIVMAKGAAEVESSNTIKSSDTLAKGE